MKILQNSGVPIYKQIAEQFEADILAGVYPQGEYLPSIRGLAKDLKISVITNTKPQIRIHSSVLKMLMPPLWVVHRYNGMMTGNP